MINQAQLKDILAVLCTGLEVRGGTLFFSFEGPDGAHVIHATIMGKQVACNWYTPTDHAPCPGKD